MTTTRIGNERTPVPLGARRRLWRRRAQVAALLVAVAFAGAGLLRAAAAPADLGHDAQVERIAASLRCPTCQGLSVADSPSQLAQGMREIITDQLDDGRSPTEVREWFVARYGPWILLDPPPTGPGVVVWFLPIAALALGGVLAWRRAHRPDLRQAATVNLGAARRRGQAWAAVWAAFALVVAAGLTSSIAARRNGDVLTGTTTRPAAVDQTVAPLRSLRQATVDQPDDPQAWLALATALDQRGELEASLRPYERAVDLARADPVVQRAAASAYVRADRPADAEPLLLDLADRIPDDPEVLLLLGTTQRALGRFTATATLRRFLRIAPNHPAADTVRALIEEGLDR